MMRKILRPYTIIPAELYIPRDADRQIDTIAAEMGRPGYVLVARQMGKTNLLLSMKRRRSDLGDIVLYQDLSNRFATPRALFRSMVDALVEISEGRLDEVVSPIELLRSKSLDANVEYERSLRLLLRHRSHPRIIIVLDEIDSLLNVSYSDMVLSQIRSMYFARGTFPEYYRLTYILSGVIEPNSLIKDRNVSPFNIGEKIYLGDFTLPEVTAFSNRIGLPIDDVLIEEVYAWSSGNPRMTWDILSELEDEVLAGRTVALKDIGEICRRLYLDLYDRPPIDHIRSLAAADRQIREAVSLIRSGEEKAVSDTVRSKLYLAGITGADPGEGQQLKNRIIDEALSEGWLAEIAREKQSLLVAAQSYFDEGIYTEAVRAIKQFVQDAEGREALPPKSKLLLGRALLLTGEFVEGASTLRSLLSDVGDNEHIEVRFYLGAALLEAGAANEAAEHLRLAAHAEGPFQYEAKLRLAAALLRNDVISSAEDILSLNREVLEEPKSQGAVDSLSGVSLEAWARYQIAAVYKATGQVALAIEHADKGLAVGHPQLQPILLHLKSLTAADTRTMVAFAEEAAAHILSGRLNPRQGRATHFGFRMRDFGLVLSRLAELSRWDTFEHLLDYGTSLFEPATGIERFSTLVEVFEIAIDPDSVLSLTWLLKAAITRYPPPPSGGQLLFEAIRLLAANCSAEEKIATTDMYFAEFKSRMTEDLLVYDDIFIFVTAIAARFQVSMLRDAERIVRLLKPFKEAAIELSPLAYILFLASEMRVYEGMGLLEQAGDAARELLHLSDQGLPDRSPGAADIAALANGFRAAARKLIERVGDAALQRKIGRNEKVRVRNAASNREYVVKYKMVESDLRSGRAILLEILG